MSIVSIIIPVYRVERYIEQCLDSVIHQSFQDIEIICIDDCGFDKSLSIVESFAEQDSRIRIIRHVQNRGLARARNSGLEVAQGDYVFFLDSDDYLQQNAIEMLYEESQRSHADVVIARTKVVADDSDNGDGDISERVLGMEKYLCFDAFEPYCVTLDNFCKSLSSLPCIACGKLYSLKFLRRYALKFINQQVIHEDEGFHIKLFSAGPVVSMIGDVVLIYRLRKGSIMDESVKIDNLQKRYKQVRVSLYDAFDYIWRHLSFFQALKLISGVQSLPVYDYYFTSARCCPYILIWKDTYKLLKILGVELWKSKTTKSGRRVCKILKIPVYMNYV